MQLNNHIAIVTGGSSGMGQACAELLEKQGAIVVVWDKVTHTSQNNQFECDVRFSDSVEQTMQDTLVRFGPPRICINCAGIAPAKRVVGKHGAMPLEAFKEVIDINLVGTFNVLRVVAESMSHLDPVGGSEERGVIINTASIAAYEGQIGQAAYSASKGGIVSMTLPIARELARHHIRVNTIAPGLVATPLFLNMPQQVQDELASNIPFPKRLGHPSEFASLVRHIIDNPLINGETIRLDGALRMS